MVWFVRLPQQEEEMAMGEREDYRAGREARREVAAAPAASLRHDESMRRAFGAAFYDVLRRRRGHLGSQPRGPENGPDHQQDREA
jgi:hypothetical protein